MSGSARLMEIKVSLFSLSLSLSRSSDGVHTTLLIDRLKVLCVIRLLELYSIRCVPNFPPESTQCTYCLAGCAESCQMRIAISQHKSLPTKKGSRTYTKECEGYATFPHRENNRIRRIIATSGRKGKRPKGKAILACVRCPVYCYSHERFVAPDIS